MFSWKYPIEWHIISIPRGDYTIEQLNEKLNQRVCELTGDHGQVIILDDDSISIKFPKIIIDVYQSSIRTVAGWPEHRNESSLNYFTYGDYFVEELD